MSWQKLGAHAWQSPLDFAAAFRDAPEIAVLYSGRQESRTGQHSYLFTEPAFHATGRDWQHLPPCDPTMETLPDWVGYLGYGMREEATRRGASPITLPDFWLTRYQRMFRFDHAKQTVEEWGRYHADSPCALPPITHTTTDLAVAELQSSMSRAAYEQAVSETIAAIEEGDFYQANITRKFFGRFDKAPDGLALFSALSQHSPAPYSCYIRHGETAILSSSPECFLTIAPDGCITSRPIKGSIRRGVSAGEDEALRKALASSGKNLAENLMIVDLMRHDLAQVSDVGSVTVAEQAGLYSYATIHHLVSTVQSRKLADKTPYDVARACFPPGSMTGAPKRAAVQWCEAQEPMERGIYSGAIGWFSATCCDLSVVIRTLVLDGDQFEFQVGGGIVAESTPEDEWHETLVKARGVAATLGISESDLEKL